MDYGRSDSSGTDDDLPPFQPGRSSRGPRVSGNGRTGSGSGQYGRSNADQNLRKIEKEAYVSVLRAFTAQSEVITWRKEQLMVTLRQELRISDDQHLQFLMGIQSGNGPNQFRESRPLADEPTGPVYGSNMDPVQPPTSRKKQKVGHSSQTSLPPPAVPSPTRTPVDTTKRAPPPASGPKSKKIKGGQAAASIPSSKPGTINSWIGKRVKIRWPDDNVFYEAVITDYNPEKDVHALTYEMNTDNETWEWVDLKELPPSDLQVIDGPPVPIVPRGQTTTNANFNMGPRGVGSKSSKKGGGRSGLIVPGRGRTTSKGMTNSFERTEPTVPARNWKTSTHENGLNLKGLKNVKLPSLEGLAKQVEKLAEEDDLSKIEAIKRMAKEHEEILRKALAEIGESSDDGESDEEGNHLFSQTHSINRERERRSRQDSRAPPGDDDEDDTAGDRGEASDGEPLGGDGGIASDGDDDHNGDYG